MNFLNFPNLIIYFDLFLNKISECQNDILNFQKRSSRKAGLKITIFVSYSFSFSSTLFFRREEKRITKVVILSHAFLLDLQNFYLKSSICLLAILGVWALITSHLEPIFILYNIQCVFYVYKSICSFDLLKIASD